mgnify:CR=1 FL=1
MTPYNKYVNNIIMILCLYSIKVLFIRLKEIDKRNIRVS